MRHGLDENMLFRDDGHRPTSFRATLQKDQTPPELPELVPLGAKDDALEDLSRLQRLHFSTVACSRKPSPRPQPS